MAQYHIYIGRHLYMVDLSISILEVMISIHALDPLSPLSGGERGAYIYRVGAHTEIL